MTSIAGTAPGRFPPGTARHSQKHELERLKPLRGTWQEIRVREGHPATKVVLKGAPVGENGVVTMMATGTTSSGGLGCRGSVKAPQLHRYDVKRGTPVWLFIAEVTTDSNGWPLVLGVRDDSLYGFRRGYLYPLSTLSLRIGDVT